MGEKDMRILYFYLIFSALLLCTTTISYAGFGPCGLAPSVSLCQCPKFVPHNLHLGQMLCGFCAHHFDDHFSPSVKPQPTFTGRNNFTEKNNPFYIKREERSWLRENIKWISAILMGAAFAFARRKF